MTDAEIERLKGYLIDLAQRLAELDNRIDEEDDDSRRSMTEAFHAFNGLAGIIDLSLVVPEGVDNGDQ